MACGCSSPEKKAAREAKKLEQQQLRQERRAQIQASAEKKVVKSNA